MRPDGPGTAAAGRVAALGREQRLAPIRLSGGLGALRGLLARPLASYYLLLASSGLLLVIGLTMVFSATSVKAYATNGNAFAMISKQALFAAIGLVVFWACQRLPARTFRALGLPLMLLSFALLTLLDLLLVLASLGAIETPKLGPVYADELWLHFGPVQLQPSELAKFGLVLWGADVLVRKGAEIGWWRELAMPLFPAVGLLFVLIGYNDFGTLLCLLILFVGLLWAAGVRLRVFAGMVLGGLAGLALLVAAPGKSDYRMARLTSFLNPSELCAQADCYQVLQGRYALADGGWFGVGLGKASLKWGWLPQGENDFIFAIIAEELGVVGCLVVLTLLAVFTYTGLRIARRVDTPFRRLAAAGAVAWLVGQAVINIGGVVQLLPITGLPLPFISDGGSALVVTLAAVGMLASFARAEPDAARALHARPPARWVRLLWAPLPPLPPAQGSRRAPGRGGAGRDRPGGKSDRDRSRAADQDSSREGPDRDRTRGVDRDRSRATDRDRSRATDRDRSRGVDRDRSNGADRAGARGGSDRVRAAAAEKIPAGSRGRTAPAGTRIRAGDAPAGRRRPGTEERRR
jgi:cell division protein FtsW